MSDREENKSGAEHRDRLSKPKVNSVQDLQLGNSNDRRNSNLIQISHRSRRRAMVRSKFVYLSAILFVITITIFLLHLIGQQSHLSQSNQIGAIRNDDNNDQLFENSNYHNYGNNNAEQEDYLQMNEQIQRVVNMLQSDFGLDHQVFENILQRDPVQLLNKYLSEYLRQQRDTIFDQSLLQALQ